MDDRQEGHIQVLSILLEGAKRGELNDCLIVWGMDSPTGQGQDVGFYAPPDNSMDADDGCHLLGMVDMLASRVRRAVRRS